VVYFNQMKHPVSFELEFKENTYPGKFIVIEGIEASGKTTQAELLVKKLEKENKVFHTKNPTNSFIGEVIRKNLLSGETKVPPIALQYLFSADREIQQQEIIESLKKGEIVVSDRYFWSSVAYGAADIEIDYDNSVNISLTAFSLLSMYHQFILPDITFYLNISVAEAENRINASDKHREIYDNSKTNEKVKKGYDWLIEKFPEQFTFIDAGRSVDEISQNLLGVVSKK